MSERSDDAFQEAMDRYARTAETLWDEILVQVESVKDERDRYKAALESVDDRVSLQASTVERDVRSIVHEALNRGSRAGGDV